MGKLNLTYWSDSLPLGPASLMEANYQQSAQHRHEEPIPDLRVLSRDSPTSDLHAPEGVRQSHHLRTAEAIAPSLVEKQFEGSRSASRKASNSTASESSQRAENIRWSTTDCVLPTRL